MNAPSSDQTETASQNDQSTEADVESELALPAFSSFLSAHGFKLVAAAGVFAVLIALFTTRAEKTISALKEADNREKVAQAYDAGVLAGKEAAEANSTAAAANEAAGLANERAAAAEEKTALIEQENLRLQALIQPRRLSPEQISKLKIDLAPYAGKSVVIKSYMGDTEGAALADQLIDAVRGAGLHVTDARFSEASNLGMLYGVGAKGKNEQLARDITRVFADTSAALTLERYEQRPISGGGVFLGSPGGDAYEAEILVGAKPITQ